MPEAEITVRPASALDFLAIERVAAGNEEPTASPAWPEWLYLEHLLATATLIVAERGGTLVGYAGAAIVGGRRPAAHVTDLFVDPAAHGGGIGGRLLRALLAAVPVDAWTTCSSSDPRAQTLYVKSGLRPLWPVMYLDGPLLGEELGGPSGARSVPLTAEAAAALELAWSGRDFATHYRHWAARPGGSPFRVDVGATAVAVGAAREGRLGPGRVLDHLAIAPDADPAPALLAALATSAVRGPSADGGAAGPAHGAGGGAGWGAADPEIRLKLALGGPNPVLPHLLGLGFRITDHDTFCTTDATLVDPARIVVDPSFG